MRKTLSFITSALVILFVACQRDELPEATSAAKTLYMQYADRSDLTVAMVGEYKGYNAVMLQADDREGWLRLLNEFDVKETSQILDKYGVDVDHNVLDDTNTRVTTMITQYVAMDTGDIAASVGQLFTSMIDSLISVAIDTAYTITESKHYEQGVLVDEKSDTTYGVFPGHQLQHNRLFQMATAHGNSGYLTYTDSDNLALWIFFYSNMDELALIIDHIVSK